MIYLVGRLLQLEQAADADDRKGIGLRTMEEQVVEPVEPGNGNWQLLAAVGSWQLDVDIACHVCDTHFSLPSSVS